MTIISLLIQAPDNVQAPDQGPSVFDVRRMRPILNYQINMTAAQNEITEKRILKAVTPTASCMAFDRSVFGATGEGASDPDDVKFGMLAPRVDKGGLRERLPFPTRLAALSPNAFRDPAPVMRHGEGRTVFSPEMIKVIRARMLVGESERQARETDCGIVAYVVPPADFPAMAKVLGYGRPIATLLPSDDASHIVAFAMGKGRPIFTAEHHDRIGASQIHRGPNSRSPIRHFAP